MTLLLLIRHAAHACVNTTIVGRSPGISLSSEGRDQAARLAARLKHVPVRAVYASPLDRALETAEAIARVHDQTVNPCEPLTEIDYGEWTGKTLDELDQDPRWKPYNSYRSATRIPGGETLPEAQLRAVNALERIAREHDGATVAAVTHGEIIRCVVAHVLGVSLDLALRMEISPASISVVQMESWGPKLLLLNETLDPAYGTF